MRVFSVIRNKKDGTNFEKGHIIDGIIFDDDETVIRWKTDLKSTSIFRNFEHFSRIHGSKGHPEYNSEIIYYKLVKEDTNPIEINENSEYNDYDEDVKDKQLKQMFCISRIFTLIILCVIWYFVYYYFKHIFGII
jgi:hypothetical protein